MCVIALLGCGSSEEDALYNQRRNNVALPAVAQVRGSIPAATTVRNSDFGGSRLVSLSFTSNVSLEPVFEPDEAYWTRAERVQILSPSLNDCEITGTDILFSRAGDVADMNVWGWDSGSSCETFFNRALAEGIVWRFENIPGMYGETIGQATFTFAP